MTFSLKPFYFVPVEKNSDCADPIAAPFLTPVSGGCFFEVVTRVPFVKKIRWILKPLTTPQSPPPHIDDPGSCPHALSPEKETPTQSHPVCGFSVPRIQSPAGVNPAQRWRSAQISPHCLPPWVFSYRWALLAHVPKGDPALLVVAVLSSFFGGSFSATPRNFWCLSLASFSPALDRLDSHSRPSRWSKITAPSPFDNVSPLPLRWVLTFSE